MREIYIHTDIQVAKFCVAHVSHFTCGKFYRHSSLIQLITPMKKQQKIYF